MEVVSWRHMFILLLLLLLLLTVTNRVQSVDMLIKGYTKSRKICDIIGGSSAA